MSALEKVKSQKRRMKSIESGLLGLNSSTTRRRCAESGVSGREVFWWRKKFWKRQLTPWQSFWMMPSTSRSTDCESTPLVRRQMTSSGERWLSSQAR